MPIKYEKVVPWGRSYQEYIKMFNLSPKDLGKSILGCADGPASFNNIMTKNKKRIISIDPLYQYSSLQIKKRIEETYPIVIEETRQNLDKYIWTNFKNVEELGEVRMKAMKEFLDDYELGKLEKRYIFAELPILPFKNNQFELALCSHFLFLYTDNLNYKFHLDSILEICRVTAELRIFPILDMNANISPYIEKIKKDLLLNFIVEEIKVDYEFQKNGNKMLKIQPRS